MTQINDTQHPPLLTRAANWWRNWLGNWRGWSEVDSLDPEQMRSIARDVGASRDELRTLAGKWPDSAAPLARRMTALGLDAADIARSQPAVSRDLNKSCSLCGEKRQCEHDLASGTVRPTWRQYCPNSGTLLALVSQRRAENSKSGSQ